MDKDTQKILSEGQAVADLVGHEGWPFARKRLTDKIMDLQSIRNLPARGEVKITMEIMARNTAIDILFEWLKEIEGVAEQHEANKNISVQSDHIVRS